MSLSVCDGGARPLDSLTPAQGVNGGESAGERRNEIDTIDLMEAERIVYGFIRRVGLAPEDYPRIERELQDRKITVYGRIYELANTSEEIQKIFELPWDAPIKVKASATDDGKIRLDVFEAVEFTEEKVVEEKKIQGILRAVLHKLVRRVRKQTIKDVFTGEILAEEEVSVATFEDSFEDFITGKEIMEDEAPDYIGVRVVSVVDIPNPYNITQGYLQKIYVFSDGAVAEFWGYKIAGGGRAEDLSALESLDAGGEGYEEPIFVFRNREVDRIWKKIYMKAIELHHKREAEEWKRQTEQWKREIEEASRKTDDVISFLRSKKDGITKQEMDWLESRSPVVRDFYVYYDPNEDVEVLWLGDELAVRIKGERFKIPIKEAA